MQDLLTPEDEKALNVVLGDPTRSEPVPLRELLTQALLWGRTNQLNADCKVLSDLSYSEVEPVFIRAQTALILANTALCDHMGRHFKTSEA